MSRLTKEQRKEIYSPIVIIAYIMIALSLGILGEATFLILNRVWI